jgi:hypothetical protein
VEITGPNKETTTDYTLRADRVTPSENDAFAPNDGFESAANISEQFTDATLWGGESDFYRVGLNASDTIDVEVVQRSADIGLYFYGPDRTQLASDDAFSNRALTVDAAGTGTHYLEVRAGGRETTTEYQFRSNRTGLLPDGVAPDPLVARFGGGDDRIGNLDVLQAVNAANSGQEIGGEPVSNLDVLQLVNRVNG